MQNLNGKIKHISLNWSNAEDGKKSRSIVEAYNKNTRNINVLLNESILNAYPAISKQPIRLNPKNFHLFCR